MFKARCSALSQIMSNPKTKGKGEIKLSLTCAKYVENWIKENKFGRTFNIDTLPIRKGNETEVQATAMVNEYLGTKLSRDNKTLSNDYLTGHLDIDWVENQTIIDTKVCKDFSTFPILDKDIELAYYWQGQGYMDLTGYNECWFAKCLTNTPIHELERMEKSKWFQLNDIYGDETNEFFVQDHEEFIKNLLMLHAVDNNIVIKGYNLNSFGIAEIHKENRIKIIKVARCQEDIDLIAPRVAEINEFLKINGYGAPLI